MTPRQTEPGCVARGQSDPLNWGGWRCSSS